MCSGAVRRRSKRPTLACAHPRIQPPAFLGTLPADPESPADLFPRDAPRPCGDHGFIELGLQLLEAPVQGADAVQRHVRGDMAVGATHREQSAVNAATASESQSPPKLSALQSSQDKSSPGAQSDPNGAPCTQAVVVGSVYYYSHSGRDAYRPKALVRPAQTALRLGGHPRRIPATQPLWPGAYPPHGRGRGHRDGAVLPISSSRSSFVTTTTFEGS